MLKRIVLAVLPAILAAGPVQAQNALLGEVELKAASRVERNAGVWLDGQYVGFVGDLRGRDRLVLVPGQHEFLFKVAGYQDLRMEITVEPGQDAEYRVAMEPEPGVTYPAKESTARLRVEVEPQNAAIFVDETFVGHVDRFDGRRGMRIAPGTYKFTVALPGYESFETVLTLRALQTYTIETQLRKTSLSDQAPELIAVNPGVPQQDD